MKTISLLHANSKNECINSAFFLAWRERAKRPERIEHVFFERDQTGDSSGDAVPLGTIWNITASLSTGDILVPVTSGMIPPVNWDECVASTFPDVGVPAACLFNVIVLSGKNEKIPTLTRALFLARGFVFHPSIGESLLAEEFLIRSELDSNLIVSQQTDLFHFCKTSAVSQASEFEKDALRMLWPFFTALSKSRSLRGSISHVIPSLMRISRKFRHITEIGIGDGEVTLALLHCLSDLGASLRTHNDQDSPDIRRLVRVQRQIDWKFQVYEQGGWPAIEETELVFLNLPADSCSLRAALHRYSDKVSAVIIVPHTGLHAFLDRRGQRGLEIVINEWLAANSNWKVMEKCREGSGYTVIVRESSSSLLSGIGAKNGQKGVPQKTGQLINIVTRTSGRPVFFNRLCHSVREQSYSSWRHVVVHENPVDLAYISAVPRVEAVSCDLFALWNDYVGPHFSDERFWEAKYNLLCNVGMHSCAEGWVLFVDDDDTLHDENTLLQLADHLSDEDTLIIHRFRFEDGRRVPPDLLFESNRIALHGIGTGCFTFHSKWRKYVRWDAYKCADYRFIVQLATVIPKIKWVDLTVVAMSSPGLGKRKDLL